MLRFFFLMIRRPPRSTLFPSPTLFGSAVLLLAVAPAGLGVAVTTTLLWLTGLPLASCSCTTGCCANGWPLCAVLEGGVVSASLVAAAALTLNGPLVTGVSGAELATRV